MSDKVATAAAYYRANREYLLEKQRLYREARRQELAVKQRAYVAAHPLTQEQRRAKLASAARGRAKPKTSEQIEARRANGRAHYAANRERIKARVLKWARCNPKSVADRNKRWSALHRETRLVCKQNRRARLAAVESTLTAQDVAEIAALQKGRCACCSEKRKLTVDHIQPISKGGPNTRRNVQMLCGTCNRQKAAKDPLVFSRSLGLLL